MLLCTHTFAMEYSYGDTATSSVMNSLTKRAIRIMANVSFGNIDLNPAYTQLGILKVSKIHSLETAKFHFKSVNNLLPVKIGNFFLTSAQQEIQHSYGLRSCNRIHPPRFLFNSNTGKNQFNLLGQKFGKNYQMVLETLIFLRFSKNLIKNIY